MEKVDVGVYIGLAGEGADIYTCISSSPSASSIAKTINITRAGLK